MGLVIELTTVLFNDIKHDVLVCTINTTRSCEVQQSVSVLYEMDAEPGTILHEVRNDDEDKVVVTVRGPMRVFTAEVNAKSLKSWREYLAYLKDMEEHPWKMGRRWHSSNPIYDCQEWRDQWKERDQQRVQAYHDDFEKQAAERRARVQAWSNQH